MSLPIFLCKLFVSSDVLFGYYWFFLRNKKFHRYNRIYLLATLIISVSISLARIPLIFSEDNADGQILYDAVQLLSVQNLESNQIIQANKNSQWNYLLIAVYSIVAIVILVAIIRSLIYIKRIRKTYPYKTVEELKIYETAEPGTPFSFFQSIFWNRELTLDSKEGQQIFRHEYYHVKEKHSADILFAEILSAIFWINPFFHLIKKELRAIHEFLADEYAMNNASNTEYAELLIQQILRGNSLAGTSHFFQNHIKRRIAMITKSQKQKYGYWSRILVLPIALLLFCGVALYAQSRQSEHRSDTRKTEDKTLSQIVRDTITPEQRQRYEAALKELEEKKKELMNQHAKQMEEIVVKQKQLQEQLGLSQQKFKIQQDELMELKMELEKNAVQQQKLKLKNVEQEKIMLDKLDKIKQEDLKLDKIKEEKILLDKIQQEHLKLNNIQQEKLLLQNVELDKKLVELKNQQVLENTKLKLQQAAQNQLRQELELRKQLQQTIELKKVVDKEANLQIQKAIQEEKIKLIEAQKEKQKQSEADQKQQEKQLKLKLKEDKSKDQ